MADRLVPPRALPPRALPLLILLAPPLLTAPLLTACQIDLEDPPDAALIACLEVFDEACAPLGDEATCQDARCVGGPSPCPALIAHGCDDLYGPLEADPDSTLEDRHAAWLADRDGYLLLALHIPQTGFLGIYRDAITAAARFAVEDINRAGALTAIPGNGRKLAVLICPDGTAVPEEGIAAASHAIACGAKALVGTFESEPTRALYVDVARPHGIPLISPGASAPALATLADLDDSHLLWRLRPSSDLAAATAGAVIRALDRHRDILVLYRAAPPEDPIAEGEALLEAFTANLCRDDFCARARLTAHGFTGSGHAIIADLTESLRDQPAPELVVTLTPDLGDLLFALTAVAMHGAEHDTVPETLLVDPIDEPDLPAILSASLTATLALADPRAYSRAYTCNLAAIGAQRHGDPYLAWEALYSDHRSLHADPSAPVGPPVSHAIRTFDAITLAAHAAAAAALADSDGRIDTPALIDGLARVTDERAPRAVRPLDWPAALEALTPRHPDERPRIDYDGASSPLDLDLRTGGVRDGETELWQFAFSDAEAAIGARTRISPIAGPIGRTAADGGLELDLTLLDALVRTDGACPPDGYPRLVTR